jgi:uncharacterized protein
MYPQGIDDAVKKDVLQSLAFYLRNLERVAVAYSGGVDSTFLLAASARVLPRGGVLALIINSPLMPSWELDAAETFCGHLDVAYRVLDGSSIMDDPVFTANPRNRCYHCKRRLFEILGGAVPDDYCLVSGTNVSDEEDFRPGMKAETEAGVRTPLRELGFTKEMIRECSRAYGLSGYDRPPSTCLATRLPYGDSITIQKIAMIARAEEILRDLGFELVRVRLVAPGMARIEVDPQRVAACMSQRERIVDSLGDIGFTQVVVDPEGYRQGRMNE